LAREREKARERKREREREEGRKGVCEKERAHESEIRSLRPLYKGAFAE